jgi:hypothetical protein
LSRDVKKMLLIPHKFFAFHGRAALGVLLSRYFHRWRTICSCQTNQA